jgi:hypothetical protein
LTAWRLSLNGEVVIDETWPPGTLGPGTIAPGVVFDSQRFPDGTPVTVTLTVTDNADRTASASGTAVVMNRALLMSRNDFSLVNGGYGARGAYNGLAMSRYVRVLLNQLGWSANDLWNPQSSGWLAGKCIYYVNTHGSVSNWHWTDSNDPNKEVNREEVYPTAAYGGQFDYLTWRQQINGSSRPPYNSTELPPTRLGFLASCYNGSNADFLSIVYPYCTWYDPDPPPVVNSAVCGFVPSILVRHHQELANWFFSCLTFHWTVEQARAYTGYHAWLHEFEVEPYGEPSRPFQMSDIQAFGDPHTRACGVYTGTEQEAPHIWFRE